MIHWSRYFRQSAIDGEARHLAASWIDEVDLARKLALHEGVKVDSPDPELGQILGDADYGDGTGMKDVFEWVASGWCGVLRHFSTCWTLSVKSSVRPRGRSE